MVPQHEVFQSLHLYGQGSRRSPSQGTMHNLTAGLYLIENAVNGSIRDGPPKGNITPVVKVRKQPSIFDIIPNPDGTVAIHSLARPSDIREVTIARDSELNEQKEGIVSRAAAEPIKDHRWQIVRNAFDSTQYMILDSATLGYWQLPSSKEGTQVVLYFPKHNVSPPPPPGIFWNLTPAIQRGLYQLLNLEFGDINMVVPPEGSYDIPIVAASSPANWFIAEAPIHPDGQTWNIFFTGSPPRDAASTADDDVKSAVIATNHKVVVPEGGSPIPDIWKLIWSPADGAYKVEDFDGICRWSLRGKYKEGVVKQEPVRCIANSDDDDGCDLWKLVRVPED
ncbi:hypothetical protein Hypma_009332 [Hypsizygus marmoreus]|uniref:Uncharacterized protein n=1 Tax=Hypsizygus marmoreus TaxID=39966 RepID=A0A369JS01_HYPMA|nr:hypothetical protein Hypma_009332 [Hypsizygus marmoreus]